MKLVTGWVVVCCWVAVWGMRAPKPTTNRPSHPPRIQLRAILIRCPFHSHYNTYKNGQENPEVDLSRGREILQFYGFDVDEPLLHAEVVRCKRKLVITVKFSSYGDIKQEETEYVVVDHAYDPLSKEKVRLLHPIVLKITQDAVMQTYPLNILHIVNGEATEDVLHKNNDPHFKGCSTDAFTATCGHAFFDGKKIPYSEGFCCSCDPNVNSKRQPMRFSVNSLMKSDVAYSLETGMVPQPLKLRMKILGHDAKKQKGKIRRKRLYPVFPHNYYNIPPMEPAKGFKASDVQPVGHGDPWQAAPPLNYYLKQMQAPSTSPPYYHILHKRNFTNNHTGHLLKETSFLEGSGNNADNQENLKIEEKQNTLWDEEPANPKPAVEEWAREAIALSNVTRKKRQTTSSGTQIRGGQDCIDRSTPPGVNPITYHESAHCLRFSELWYNVYALKEAFLSHSVEFHLFEKHCLESVGEQWVFKTSGFKAEVGTFCRRTANPATTMVFSYTPLDITHKDFICLTPGHYLLLIPRPIPQEKIAEYPQPAERSGRWLLLSPELVVFDGDECDKVGVSYSAFSKQPERCNRPQGSCLRNQPLQMWRHDTEKESKGERGKYFLENYGRVPENALAKFMNKEYLNLFYEGQYRSVVEIEYKADSNGIIRKESTAQVTEVYVDSTCEHHTKITVMVTNNGLVSSMFRPRMTNCPVNIPAVWTQQEGPLVVIAPQRKHLFRLSLYGSLPSTRFHCSIEILNPKHKIVAVRRITIQRFDRCLCMWHCLCACSGSIEALKCDPMTIEHYHAAGFYGSMAVDTSSFSTEDNFQMLYMIGRTLPILLIMHLLLFLLGLVKAIAGLFNEKICMFLLYLVCPALLNEIDSEPDEDKQVIIKKAFTFLYNTISFFVAPGWILVFLLREIKEFFINLIQKLKEKKDNEKDNESTHESGDIPTSNEETEEEEVAKDGMRRSLLKYSLSQEKRSF